VSAQTNSRSAAFAALVFGVILTALTFAAFNVVDGRDPPMRTAELSIPLPEMPVPPGVIPQGDAPALR
jgi:hypothetical protein